MNLKNITLSERNQIQNITLYDKIYANFFKNQKYRDKKQIHAFGVGAGFDCKWAPGNILGRLKYSITELRILDYCINLHKINEL